MSPTTLPPSAEAEIRHVLERWVASIQDLDIKGATAPHAEDVVAFDGVDKLQLHGLPAYRQQWEMGFAMAPGSMIFRPGQVTIVAEGSVGFAYFPLRCGFTDEKGQEMSHWSRATICYRKIAGQWRVVHEHSSVPFDMETGKALFHLQP